MDCVFATICCDMRTVLARKTQLIRWKLRELMARERMSIRKLSELTGLHKNTIALLRQQDTLPGMAEGTMEKLCRALNCTPYDLIEYIPEPEEK